MKILALILFISTVIFIISLAINGQIPVAVASIAVIALELIIGAIALLIMAIANRRMR